MSFLLRCVAKMSPKRMFRAVSDVSKETGKFPLFILIDMVYCAFRYGTGYVDYRTFNFAKMSAKRRKTFVTRVRSNQIIRKLNNREDYDKFENKIKFNSLFKDYVKRDWVFLKDITPEEFGKFLEGKSAVMAKPVDALCGQGVEKIPAESADYGRLVENQQLLVEEYIVQHSELAKIYSGSVNTVRIVTIANSDGVHVMFRALRVGNSGNAVDNFHFGGMVVILDGDGVVVTDAVNEKNEIFASHPVTGTVFKGTRVPFMREIEETVKNAARVVPGIRYVGWDVAVREDGPLLIEANHNPAYDFYQTRAYMAENEYGLLPLFKSVMK